MGVRGGVGGGAVAKVKGKKLVMIMMMTTWFMYAGWVEFWERWEG